MNCAYFYVDHTNGRRSNCPHPRYKGDLCIFHFRDAAGKRAHFKDNLAALIAKLASAPESQIYDFKGFVFPQHNFQRAFFNKDCDFRHAEFHESVDFRGAEFAANVDFHGALFSGPAVFHSVQFNGDAHFIGCVFKGRTTFSGSKFRRGGRFHGCKFHDFAAWQACKFGAHTIIQSDTFLHDADFRMAVFYRGVDFDKTLFQQRADFEGARLHEEVRLTDTHIAFLKKLNCRRANMDGAVLHTAQVWENPRLESYSFRNAFLVSVNLSGKELVNCDFTGAVFKAVLTLGWKLDRWTLANTKYIYTDYRVEEVVAEGGGKERRYFPVEDSRVPADGFFGLGEHLNFTIADYLREPFRWNLALNVPVIFRTAVANYLQFFADFMRVTQGIPVEVRTRLEGSKMRVEFLTVSEADLDAVKSSFDEYRQSTGRNFEEMRLKISFSKQTSPLEQKLFVLEFERQIDSLKTKLAFAQALLEQSKENESLLRQLIEVQSEPRKFLLPAAMPAPRQYDAQQFVLKADLADYSKTVKEDQQLQNLVQQFIAKQQIEIQGKPGCNLVKAAGDGLLVVGSDAIPLIGVAKDMASALDSVKLSNPCPLRGFRFIFAYGTLTCIELPGTRDYSGDPMVEVDRIDQPMKRFLEREKRGPSEMWCNQAFRDQVGDKHANLKFEELPKIELDKEFTGTGSLFRLTII